MARMLRTVTAVLMVLFAVPAISQDSERLDRLFEELDTASDAESARAIVSEIWRAWNAYDGPSTSVQPLMGQGWAAVRFGRSDVAVRLFTAAILADPTYPEAWNARAIARYFAGDTLGAIEDIHQALAREPRHFGAFSLLGFSQLRLGNHERALAAFEAAHAINRFMPSVETQVLRLRRILGGRPV